VSGLHVIGRGELPAWALNRRGPVEAYDESRFFTVTGDVFEGLATIGPLQGLDVFLEAAGLRREEPSSPNTPQPCRSP
jgi:primase-polymerase (primpol)-like protein